MSYDANTPIRLAPDEPQDMSADQWVAVLRAAGSFNSPLWNGVPDPEVATRAMWQMVTTRRHRASFWLSIPGREHTFGTAADSVLRRNDTRSWTNARTCRTPGMHYTIVRDAVRKSEYVRYDDVLDSLLDGLNRVDDPNYAYAGKLSVSDVIHIWTESEGDAYTAYCVAKMNEWSADMAQGDDPEYAWLPSPSFGYPRGTHGRGGATVDRIIIHTTEGSYAGSLSWLRRQPTPTDEGSSTHYLLSADGTQRAQLVREADAAWTAGNGVYNRRGVNIEHEGQADVGGFSDALYEASAQLAARVIKRNPAILPDRVHIIGHNDVPDQSPDHHHDPGPHWDWDRYIARVAAIGTSGGQSTNPTPDVTPSITLPQTQPDPWKSPLRPDTWIVSAFVKAIKDEGFPESGYVCSEAFAEDGKVVQYFERTRWEIQPNGAVTKGRVGYEAMVARYPDRKSP